MKQNYQSPLVDVIMLGGTDIITGSPPYTEEIKPGTGDYETDEDWFS